MSFSIDTSKPLPGPYRLPNDNERRNRLYLEKPYRDITTVCELNPDIQEHTDATLRLFVQAPEMLKLLRTIASFKGHTDCMDSDLMVQNALEIIRLVEKGSND